MARSSAARWSGRCWTTRRTIRNISSVAGLRAATDLPGALLRDARLRMRLRRAEARKHPDIDDGGPDLDPDARMLIAEYHKFALSRAWHYYPDALPPEAVSDTQREGNGHVDRALSFPLEDLYPDGEPAGQVGQEVYGVGVAFIFARRAFHRIEGAPFLLFCDNLLRAGERTGDRALTIQLDGGETCVANLRLLRLKRRRLPRSSVTIAGGDAIRAHTAGADRIDYHVPAQGRLILTWK